MGIGFETTKYIINNTASLVVVYGLHAVEECLALKKANPGRLSIFTGDVTKPSNGKDAIKFALEKMGGLDTLVYCIGIMAPIERIADVDLDKVRQTFEVNVFGCISMVSEQHHPLQRYFHVNSSSSAREQFRTYGSRRKGAIFSYCPLDVTGRFNTPDGWRIARQRLHSPDSSSSLPLKKQH